LGGGAAIVVPLSQAVLFGGFRIRVVGSKAKLQLLNVGGHDAGRSTALAVPAQGNQKGILFLLGWSNRSATYLACDLFV